LRGSCLVLGLDRLGFVMHSFRHGGATHDILAGDSVEDVMRHGRWASTKSARHYIQSGRARSLSNDVPARVHRLGLYLAERLLEAWALPQQHLVWGG
jgi:hypothetical protein